MSVAVKDTLEGVVFIKFCTPLAKVYVCHKIDVGVLHHFIGVIKGSKVACGVDFNALCPVAVQVEDTFCCQVQSDSNAL